MQDETNTPIVPGLTGADKPSPLSPALQAELRESLGKDAARSAAVPFVKADAPANLPAPKPVPATPAAVKESVMDTVIEAGEASGSTPISPEQTRNDKPANDPQPVHTPNPNQEKPMASNFDYNRATEAAQNTAQNTAQQFQHGAQQAADTVRKQTEDMTRQGQQAMTQATERSREVMDKGMKAFEEFNTHARGNADAALASSRAAAQGIEQIVQQTAEFTRKTFESATSAMRTMASARTPTDVMQAQNEFAKAQFDNMVGEFSRLTETMMKVANQVFEPMQNQVSEAAAKAGETVKGMINTSTQR